MTKSMKANKELNRIFTELQSGYEKMNVKQQRFALREFKRIQLEITEILIDSAPTSRIRKTYATDRGNRNG